MSCKTVLLGQQFSPSEERDLIEAILSRLTKLCVCVCLFSYAGGDHDLTYQYTVGTNFGVGFSCKVTK